MRRAAWRAGVWRSGLAVAVIVLLVACSDDDPPVRTAPSIPEATPAPSTTNPDPYAIPPVIDETYINRVLAAHEHAAADALRSSMKERVLTERSLQILQAVYSDNAFREQINALQESAEEGFRGYRANPGAVRTTVDRMISAGPTCAFFSVNRNYDEVASNPASDLPMQYVALRRLAPDAPPNEHNPTPWIVIYDGFQQDHSQPPDPCASPS